MRAAEVTRLGQARTEPSRLCAQSIHLAEKLSVIELGVIQIPGGHGQPIM